MCRKRTYRSKSAAKTERSRGTKDYGVKMAIYWCQTCHGWHITKRRWELLYEPQ